MFILKLGIAHIYEKGNAALSSGGIAEVWCGDEVSVFLPPDPPGTSSLLHRPTRTPPGLASGIRVDW